MVLLRFAVPVVLFALLSLWPGRAAAETAQMVQELYTGARFDVMDENYDAALAKLVKAQELAPEDLRIVTLMARVFALQGREDEAVDLYDALIARDPARFGLLNFEVAYLLQKKERYEEALARFKAAEKADFLRAIKEQGLTYMKLGKFAEADAAFARVREAKDAPPKTRQLFLYLGAQTNYHRRDYKTALKRLDKAYRLDPSSDLVSDIKAFRKTTLTAMRQARPWRLYVSAAYRYDDNIYLNPFEENPSGKKTTDKGDSSLQTGLTFSYRLAELLGATIGLTAGASKLSYFHESAADFAALNIGAYVGKSWKTMGVRLPYQYTYYWAGASLEERLAAHSLNPVFFWQMTDRFRTEVSGMAHWKNYRDQTPDAFYYGLGAVHILNFGDQAKYVRLGYQFAVEDADDGQSGYRIWEVTLGGGAPIYGPLAFDLGLTLAYYTYNERPSWYYGLSGTEPFTRRDRQIRVSVRISYRFSERWQFGLGYYFTHNDSNVGANDYDPFKFQKNLFSLSVFGAF